MRTEPAPPAPQLGLISSSTAVAPKPERTLLTGYNSALQVMLRELNEYVAPGSAVTVVALGTTPAFPTFGTITVDFRYQDARRAPAPGRPSPDAGGLDSVRPIFGA
jgi:hypothetical protein